MPVAKETGKLILGKNKETLWAERYGGEGLGYNGGGVRCGLHADLQIKGVGQNPLVGSDAEFYHSYGGAGLGEVMLEAIWGEVCTGALPYGASRVTGILGTGTKVPLRYPRSKGPTVTPRVLAIRIPKVRPAHFMRAIYHRSTDPSLRPTTDTARTSAAIGKLAATFDALGMAKGRDDDVDLSHSVREGMEEFCRRAATQLACARVKRIMHGSLTASNLSVDGGWLDFTSISTVSDYGPIRLPRGAPDFLHEQRLIFSAMSDWTIYIRKYLKVENDPGYFDNLFQYLKVVFDETLEHRLSIEFAKLAGVLEPVLQALPGELVRDFYQITREIAGADNREPFTILSSDNDYVPVMPTQMGRHHLNSLLATIATAQSIAQSDELLKPLLADARLRKRLCLAYWNLFSAAVTSQSADSQSQYAMFWRINALRKNAPLERLYRTKLYPAIDAAVESGADVANFIDTTIRYAEPSLHEVQEGAMNFAGWCFTNTCESDQRIALLSGDPLLPERLHGALDQAATPVEFFAGMEKLCAAVR